jgi:hypothetical protein
MKKTPAMTYNVSRIRRTITMYVWILPANFTPERLIPVKKIMHKIAIILICRRDRPGLNSIANIPIPKSANADLKASENHAESPPRVPIMGPILLSVKK